MARPGVADRPASPGASSVDVADVAVEGPGPVALLLRDSWRGFPRPGVVLAELPGGGRALRGRPLASAVCAVQVASLSRPQLAPQGPSPDGKCREWGPGVMNIAFCYDSVLPTRGGCETYITALARRLVADGHQVH